MSLDIEERVKYYLGELFYENKVKIYDKTSLTSADLVPNRINNQEDIAIYFKKYNYKKLYLVGNLYNIHHITSFSIDEITRNVLIPEMFFKCYFNDYAKQLKHRLEQLQKNNNSFLCDFCDVFYPVNKYAFVKNRYSEEEKKTVILKCLNKKRHWNLFYNRPNDIPFENKLPKIYWRGTTTGKESSQANRFILVKRHYEKNPDIDIAFSFTCQGKGKYDRYTKGKEEISEFLRHKYILSIEGNDKDSGINWKLNSNSLVLMPKPKVFSWLMEDKLIPGHHYIQIKDDFSDIEEKLNWCKQNDEKCQLIIKNANRYMEQFKNEALEEEIENRVIALYFEKTCFEAV